MVHTVNSAVLSGVEPYDVRVEVDLQKGLPKFDIVGLPKTEVKEGRDRIVSALRSVGVTWKAKRIVVNLSPAAVPKSGASLDLPIAIALLQAFGVVGAEVVEGWVVLGELSLDGQLQYVRGSLAFAELACQESREGLILPPTSARELGKDPPLRIKAPRNLADLKSHFLGENVDLTPSDYTLPLEERSPDWCEVGGQRVAKRAMEISAAGKHNLLFGGVPGVGKTLLARRMPGVIPSLSLTEQREVRRIYSAAGFPDSDKKTSPPFRSPHHGASLAGFLGGGRPFRPGELTLAHRGVLFLDELPEFRRDVLEALREPMGNGFVTVSRAEGGYHLPANFIFLAAMNLCPCGALGDDRKECVCTPFAVDKYRRKISSPIRERIDLLVELPKPKWEEIWKPKGEEKSEEVLKRTSLARERQIHRQRKANGELSAPEIHQFIQVDPSAEALLKQAAKEYGLSPRGIHKSILVAQTIVDLEGGQEVQCSQIAEALQYRATKMFSN